MKIILQTLTFLLSVPLTSLAAAPPNIILMMGDDHGWEETGYNGHPHVKTPVLDEMAATGLRFERFYAAHPSCSPTRASFLTGRHPNRMGTFAPGWSLRPEEITIAHLLAKAGYHCVHFGKWHVGAVKAGSPVNPGAMGFHEWLSHDNFFELNPSFSRNGGPPEVFKGESSEILIREAIAGIGRARTANKPFFQVIWFGSPHEPYSGLPAGPGALRRPARQIPENGRPHLERNRRQYPASAGRSAARALRGNHRHGPRDRHVAQASRRNRAARQHAAALLRRQRHLARERAGFSASRSEGRTL